MLKKRPHPRPRPDVIRQVVSESCRDAHTHAMRNSNCYAIFLQQGGDGRDGGSEETREKRKEVRNMKGVGESRKEEA